MSLHPGPASRHISLETIASLSNYPPHQGALAWVHDDPANSWPDDGAPPLIKLRRAISAGRASIGVFGLKGGDMSCVPKQSPKSVLWRPGRVRNWLIAGVIGLLFPTDMLSAPSSKNVPQFGGNSEFAWHVNFWDFMLDPPAGSGHGPMKTDPAYPYNSQIQNGHGFHDGELQAPIVNAKDPILKPWAAKEMQQTNDELLSGKRKLPFIAQSRCWPGGVPGQLLFLDALYFIQTPREVLMMWERDSFVRHIRIGDNHPAHLKPSWFGDSIGHYEGSDTLVVDTIGISGGKFHYLDSFRTPHTDKLHVVERFTVSADKQTLTAIIHVEDPGTFNGPLTLKETWGRRDKVAEEIVCAEDGGVDHFHQNVHPIPQALTRDF